MPQQDERRMHKMVESCSIAVSSILDVEQKLMKMHGALMEVRATCRRLDEMTRHLHVRQREVEASLMARSLPDLRQYRDRMY